MRTDWIDQEKARRDRGHTRVLTQSQHEAVNGRHPDCTKQRCVDCDDATGRTETTSRRILTPEGDEHGPLCEDCWHHYYEQDGYTDPLE